MNVMQDELRVLNVVDFSSWIDHLKIQKITDYELFHTSIFGRMFFIQSFP